MEQSPKVFETSTEVKPFEFTRENLEDLWNEYQKYGRQIDIFNNPKEFLTKIFQLYIDYGKRILEAKKMFKEKEGEDVNDSGVLQAVAMTEVEKSLKAGPGIETGPQSRIEDIAIHHYRLLVYAAVRILRYLQLFLDSEHRVVDKDNKTITELSEAPTEDDVRKIQDFSENPEIKKTLMSALETDQELRNEGVAFL